MGPRKIPVIGDYETKCEVLENTAVFKVDFKSTKVEVVNGAAPVDVGAQLLYTYE